MTTRGRTLELHTSPHITSGSSVDVIMRNVVWALLPVAGFAIYSFGLTALLTLAVAVLSCVATEHLLCRASAAQTTVNDWSVTITGLLYGLTLPPALPLWMVACGGIIGVAMGKFLFGGLGYNAFNPALVGRAFLQAAFPAAMTSWTPALAAERFTTLPSSTLTFPFAAPDYDGVSGATPLSLLKFDGQLTATPDLMLGLVNGSTGETCALLILAGGIFLAARRMLNWRIPVAIFATVALLSGLFHAIDPEAYAPPGFMLFSGGLMLGAVFMATDMVASPITHAGAIAYGVLIGVLITVIRFWGGMPEGVMYAILLANAVSPHIDGLIQPRVFGTDRR
ncbi:MAG: RnfABCDGE type electron transport complex subunit D [Halioglobus sp.]|jgi:Na+-translocating ferredoxin:NAD+ oxidoreductase subunit D